MTDVKDGFVLIPIREAWFELAGPDGDEEARIAEIVGRLEYTDEALAARLARSLRTVAGVASSLPPGSRRNYALVLWPNEARVEALLSIRVSRTVPDGYANYLALASTLQSDDETEVIRRTVEEARLPLGRAIISHDFTLPIEREGVSGQALERTFLALFPDESVNALEFTLLTQNLALFEDSSAYLMALAAGEDPALPGMD